MISQAKRQNRTGACALGLGLGLIVGFCILAFAQGDKNSVNFPTSSEVNPEIIRNYCQANSFYKVIILKNSRGQIGGYVLQPAVMDSPIPYLDCQGKQIAVFHIFGTDAEKAKANSVIEPLLKAFPVQELYGGKSSAVVAKKKATPYKPKGK
jgi:hypothetical protein